MSPVWQIASGQAAFTQAAPRYWLRSRHNDSWECVYDLLIARINQSDI
jgi:hypothetical protein